MSKKIFTIIDGRPQEVKGKDLEKLNSVIVEERMTLKELKDKFPDKYEMLVNWLK